MDTYIERFTELGFTIFPETGTFVSTLISTCINESLLKHNLPHIENPNLLSCSVRQFLFH